VSLTGTWIGTTTDSTGTMMGAGLSPSMQSNMTWNLTQTGTSFDGTVQFAGYGGGLMRVSGDVVDHSATFMLSIPTGSMPMMRSGCTATATGTIDLDTMVMRMQGSYTGTNTCTGPFDQGQLSMHRP
jgi:hypothetical protein